MANLLPWFAFTCPKCGAGPDKTCRTTSGTNRTTDTHKARVDLYYDQRAHAVRHKNRTTTP